MEASLKRFAGTAPDHSARKSGAGEREKHPASPGNAPTFNLRGSDLDPQPELSRRAVASPTEETRRAEGHHGRGSSVGPVSVPDVEIRPGIRRQGRSILRAETSEQLLRHMKYRKILENTFLFNVVEDSMERANLKERMPDVYSRLIAE